MAIPLYLAKTAAEFALTEKQPDHLAWMACHFSPYGTGLTNLPTNLPENSLLILNDRTPVHAHDPARVKDTLSEIVSNQNCCGVLLDLQRPSCTETAEIVKVLLTLPCPVCISDLYAKELDCPVFLPPVPLTATVEEYLAPWQNREIWLDAALESLQCRVTENGPVFTPTTIPLFPAQKELHLHFHYHINVEEDSALFSIWRTAEDLHEQLLEAEEFGIKRAVGLWQEFKNNE